MKKYLALILLVSIFSSHYETTQAEPITIAAITTLGVSTYAAIKSQKHCSKLCTAQNCGSEVLNKTRDALTKFLGPVKDSTGGRDSTFGAGLRNIGEFCLNTCTTDDQKIFFEIPNAIDPSAPKRVDVTIKKRYGEGWDLKACVTAYGKLAESKETSFLYPKSNQAYVYSDQERLELLGYANRNDFASYAVWQKNSLHEILGMPAPKEVVTASSAEKDVPKR
ncbi:MAG: hypothetical protein ACTHJ4_00850 [Candidatus Nucleicultricaceae bacterium]